MGQKTDTLERERTETGTSTSHGSTTDEPPSWSELSEKADTGEMTRNTLLLTGAALAFNLFLPIPGGILTTVFAITLIGSAVGLGDVKSGALTGGIVGGVSAFFGSILFSLLTLGIATVLPSLIIGAIIGAIGGFVGSQLK